MSVKIVGITESLVPGITKPDEFMAYCARVSNPTNQLNNETAGKLLNYCARNSHWSVFEMVDVALEIETTRDIARQILRHRSFSFQEFSQRYANPTMMPFVLREARLQDVKNRQNSIEVSDAKLAKEWEAMQSEVLEAACKAYEWAADRGIAKEQCRVVLPEGMTTSRLYMKGSVRSWIHYCKLRMGNGTQKEHQLVAKDCWKVLCERMPALKEIDLGN